MDRTDDYAQYLDDYQTLRTQVRDINSQLLDLLSRKTLKQARRRLDLHRLPLDEEAADVARTVLVDYAIHFARRGGRRLQEVYFDEHSPEPGSLLDVYRRHLDTYHYTILRIQDTEPGVGIEVADLLQDEETFFLMDRNFSQTVDVGAAINTGILHLPDYALTTGAALPLPQTAGKHLAAKIPEQIGAPREVDFATLPPPKMAKLAALIIRTALHEGAASKVGYR
jgi:hypothetical protein